MNETETTCVFIALILYAVRFKGKIKNHNWMVLL